MNGVETASNIPLRGLHESQSNVYAVRGDLDDAISLQVSSAPTVKTSAITEGSFGDKAAADEVSKLNEGSLDFLICNGAALTCPRSDCMITT